MSRPIGSNTRLPSGAGPGSLGGDDPSFARMNHRHGLWHKWEELELSTGWIPGAITYTPDFSPYRPLSVAKAGNLIEVNGVIDFDGDPNIDPTPNLITTLPVEYRPDKDIVVSCFCVIPFPLVIVLPSFVLIQVGMNGELNYLESSSVIVAPANFFSIFFTNFLFRTDYP